MSLHLDNMSDPKFLQYSRVGLWVRVFLTIAVIALVAGLSSDTFVNGRHGNFLNNGDVVVDWDLEGKRGEYTLGKANCRPRENKNGDKNFRRSSCDSDCTDGAT